MRRAHTTLALAVTVMVAACSEDGLITEGPPLPELSYAAATPDDLCWRDAPGGLWCGSRCSRLDCTLLNAAEHDFEQCYVSQSGADEGQSCPGQVLWWCDESIPVPAMTFDWLVACYAHDGPVLEAPDVVRYLAREYPGIVLPTPYGR